MTKTPEPPTRRSRRRDVEMLRIEKAALTLSLERGLDGVTADDIAEVAEISRRTFFRYFPSRDDVFAAVHTRSMRRVFENFRSRPLDEPFITAYLEASRTPASAVLRSDEVEVTRLAARLLVKYPDTWSRIIAKYGKTIEDELAEIIRFRFERSGHDLTDASLLASVAWAVSCHVFLVWLKGGGKGDIHDRIQAAFNRIRLEVDMLR
jgi:AcrR family transcriptional regulator